MNKVVDIEKAPTSVKVGMIYRDLQKMKQMMNAIYHKIDSSQQSKELNVNIEKKVSGLTVPSYIPDIAPKQIYKLSKMGWTKEQICAISGYSPEEAQKKYESYVRNNV